MEKLDLYITIDYNSQFTQIWAVDFGFKRKFIFHDTDEAMEIFKSDICKEYNLNFDKINLVVI